MIIQVLPYDPGWPAAFDAQASRIRAALGDLSFRLHHIGSTSVAGLCAKPIIDMLLEVSDLKQLEARTSALEALGYEAKGEFGIPERRYFPRNDASGLRTHQLHAFVATSAAVIRHLAFRDYLRAHPAVRLAYGELKRELARQFPHDADAYMDGKDAFIKDYEARALQWRSA